MKAAEAYVRERSIFKLDTVGGLAVRAAHVAATLAERERIGEECKSVSVANSAQVAAYFGHHAGEMVRCLFRAFSAAIRRGPE